MESESRRTPALFFSAAAVLFAAVICSPPAAATRATYVDFLLEKRNIQASYELKGGGGGGGEGGMREEEGLCCDYCGFRATSPPALGTCRDILKECPSWCEDCVHIAFQAVLCNDLKINYCHRRCS